MRFLFLLLFFTLAPLQSVFAQEQFFNLGFLKDTIWFSKDPFFHGENVRIYSAVFNSSANDLKGSVNFSINNSSIGTADFTALKEGGVGIVWADWDAKEGEHSFSAKITTAKLALQGGPEQEIEVSNDTAKATARIVDIDTDKDQIGDREDADDDNDGISDAREQILGTNPKLADTDGDTIPDNEDTAPLVATKKPEESEAKEAEEVHGASTITEKIGSTALVAGKSLKEKVDGAIARQHAKLEAGKKQIQETIIQEGKRGQEEQGRLLTKLKNYGALAVVTIASLAFKYPIILYLLSLFILYKLVMRIWTRHSKE